MIADAWPTTAQAGPKPKDRALYVLPVLSRRTADGQHIQQSAYCIGACDRTLLRSGERGEEVLGM